VVTTLALILTIAFFDPVRERLRALLDRSIDRRDLPYRRLVRAFGGELLAAQRPQEAIGPALAQLCQSLGIGAAAVHDHAGAVVAAYGAQEDLAAGSALALPLTTGDASFGRAIFGPKRSRLPYRDAETDLLRDAATFIAASLQLAERQAAQAAALESLAGERTALEVREATLAAALERTAPDAGAASGLRVQALGPLRVELAGETLRQWGGAKAGSRQAVAIFAFLFDRGERGVAKDEFLELIWPDVPLDKADLAFHRTIGGLRRTLESGLARAGEGTVITFSHDRYRLAASAVAWSDIAAFEERLATAGTASEATDALAALEAARALYRGEYLDDCPFYGDSEFVEERRATLRARHVDLLLALGARYEERGDGPAAAACFREALRIAADDCPRAAAGLARLGLAA
jgi:DNA-binding SARP family transcriptional activator